MNNKRGKTKKKWTWIKTHKVAWREKNDIAKKKLPHYGQNKEISIISRRKKAKIQNLNIIKEKRHTEKINGY